MTAQPLNKQAGTVALKIVLVLAGLFIVYTGLNRALGGIMTLGWQGGMDFFQVTDDHTYQVQDSHIRFIGGLWLGIGLLFIAAPLRLAQMKQALYAAFAFTFLGGLVRFSQMQLDITLGPEIIGSLIAELIGMPLLAWWLSKVTKSLQ